MKTCLISENGTIVRLRVHACSQSRFVEGNVVDVSS